MKRQRNRAENPDDELAVLCHHVHDNVSIARRWELILDTLQKKDAPLKSEDISRTQDEFEMGDNECIPPRFVCEPLGTHDRQGRGTSDIKSDRHIHPQAKNATKRNILLKRAEELRPKTTDTVNEVEEAPLRGSVFCLSTSWNTGKGRSRENYRGTFV